MVTPQPTPEAALAPPVAPPEGEVEPTPPPFDARRIFIRMIVATVAIVLVVVGALLLFRNELTALSNWFVESFGGIGVALGFFLPDAFTVPLPNDAFTFFAYTGGMPFWECVAWGTGGSLVGGTVGFFIGRSLQRTRWYRRIMATRGREVTQMVERYAVLTLVFAALAPIPYSLACWAVGAGGMRFGLFFLISLLRFVKVALYLWLLAEGILPAFGDAPA